MMTHSFVHVGDPHLGPGPRQADRLRALDQIISESTQLLDLAAWLIPGDLFHSRSTVDDRNALAERLRRMAAVGPVVLMYGNHDAPGDLDIFGKLEAEYPIYVVAEPQVLSIDLATGGQAAIACLPYPSKAGLVSAGVQPSEINLAARGALEAILRGFGVLLDGARERGAIPLFLAHINIAGATTSAGQPSIGVESLELDPAHLALLGDCYKGLNHVHQGQTIAGAWYAGSICRLSWGETEEKRYLVAQYQDPTAYTVRSCPIDVPPMYHVEAQLDRDGLTWQVTAGPGCAKQDPPATWKGAEVRVRVRFKQSEKSALVMAPVYAEFAEAARLEVEPIAVPDRQLRAPAVAEAHTLADKLRAYAGPAATEGVLAKLAQLEHGDGLRVLSDVQTDLARLEAGEKEQEAAA